MAVVGDTLNHNNLKYAYDTMHYIEKQLDAIIDSINYNLNTTNVISPDVKAKINQLISLLI